jgi:signal transduction histidine kinase
MTTVGVTARPPVLRKHARAAVARVDVHAHDWQLVVSIQDDGAGFRSRRAASFRSSA